MSGARVIQVIETYIEVRGSGQKGNPFRKVFQYWTPDGTLLAEADPLITGRGQLIEVPETPEEEKKEEA